MVGGWSVSGGFVLRLSNAPFILKKSSGLQINIGGLKPGFHSRFPLVVSEIFRIGHAQSGETNYRTE